MIDINGTEVMIEQSEEHLIAHQVRIIIRNTATHTQQAHAHHSQCQYQAGWGHDPEMHLAPKLVHPATGRFGEPVIDRSKEWEDKSPKDRVVEMTHDEVCIGQVKIY